MATTDELVSQVMQELNIDDIDNNKLVFITMANQAMSLVNQAFNESVISKIQDDLIYQRIVTALMYKLMVDPQLSDGWGMGIQMMINTLKGKYADEL